MVIFLTKIVIELDNFYTIFAGLQATSPSEPDKASAYIDPGGYTVVALKIAFPFR